MRLFPSDSKRSGALGLCAVASLGVATVVAGCGTVYRPVVTPITPSGPSAQPQSFAAVVSAPSPTSPGIATIIDYSGDAIMAQSPIGPGPVSFSVDGTGSTGYTVNSDGTLTNFQISTTLQYKNLQYSTLVSGTKSVNLFSPTAGLWLADNGSNGDLLDILVGYPETFKQSVPVAANPVVVTGPSNAGQRNYVISQIADLGGLDCNASPTTVTTNGVATPIEVSSSSYTADQAIGLDPFNATNSASTNAVCPVYAVESTDGKRVFVLNRGSDTVSVINSQNNTLDQCTPFVDQTGQTVTCHPLLPLSTTAVSALQADAAVSGAPTGIPTAPPNGTKGMTAVAGPVYAEYNSTLQELVVANYDGGTISVIDVSLDQYGNDSQTFGTTFTIPVGHDPASVTVVNDPANGARAYTANQADETVTIVNLTSHSVEKTVPVTGHPRTVVSTSNSLYGKVYVGSPDSPYLTILRTDQDIVDTTILLEGNTVDVRVSSQNGSSGNSNVSTRIPGFGQPCSLPPACYSGTTLTIGNCQAQPTALCTPGAGAGAAMLKPAKISLP